MAGKPSLTGNSLRGPEGVRATFPNTSDTPDRHWAPGTRDWQLPLPTRSVNSGGFIAPPEALLPAVSVGIDNKNFYVS